MFDSATRNKIEGAFNVCHDLISKPVTWHQAKAPQATKTVDASIVVARLSDEEIVNAYGVGTRIITVKASDLPGLEKFDRFEEPNGEIYTIDGVQTLYVNNTLAFWQGYSKGH